MHSCEGLYDPYPHGNKVTHHKLNVFTVAQGCLDSLEFVHELRAATAAISSEMKQAIPVPRYMLLRSVKLRKRTLQVFALAAVSILLITVYIQVNDQLKAKSFTRFHITGTSSKTNHFLIPTPEKLKSEHSSKLFTMDASSRAASKLFFSPQGNLDKIRNPRKAMGLDVHVWRFPFPPRCLRSFAFLCNHPFFPEYPTQELHANRSEILRPGDEGFYQRLMGFVHPPVSGSYEFDISSDDSSELWLSRDSQWQNSRRIAHKYDPNRSKQETLLNHQNQISERIGLVEGQAYYLEVLHMQITQENHLRIRWKTPGSTEFRVIQGSFLSPLFDPNTQMNDVYNPARFPRSVSCVYNTGQEINPFLNDEHLSYEDHSLVQDTLPSCQHKPSYIVNKKMQFKYQAIGPRYLHHSQVFPDRSGHAQFIVKNAQGHFSTPPELDRAEAEDVVESYMKALQRKYASG